MAAGRKWSCTSGHSRSGADRRNAPASKWLVLPVPEQQPAQADQGLAQRVQPAVQGDGFEAPILAVDFQVILQVLAHTGQLVPQRYPGIRQHVRGADPGTLQQRRRTDRARRQDDLSRRVDFDNATAAAQADAGHHAAIAQDPLRGRARVRARTPSR